MRLFLPRAKFFLLPGNPGAVTTPIMENTTLERRTVVRKIEVTELRCSECRGWFRPRQQPPRGHIATCSLKCRVARHRRLSGD